MLRLPRIVLMLVAVAAMGPVLAGCSGFDPDSLDILGLSNKKPLPGKREALFPNGVPGVTQGMPPQYKEGYKAPAVGDLPPGDADATPPAGASRTAAAAPTTPVKESNLGAPMKVHQTAAKHRVKPKRHRVVKHKATKKKATATAAKPKTEPKGAAAPWPSTPTAQKGTQAPWPSNSSASSGSNSESTQAGWPSAKDNSNAKPKLAPWPSAPPSGSFSKE